MTDCWEPPEHPVPPESGVISDLMLKYNELQGGGVRKNWKELSDEVSGLTKTHSYARIFQETRYANAYEIALAAALRQRDGDVSPEIYEQMQHQLAYERTLAEQRGPAVVSTGPGLVSHVDYLTDKPGSISAYERWVLNRKAVFVFRNRIPRMLDAIEETMQQGEGGVSSKEEAIGLWTEVGEKRNRTMAERNKWVSAYNNMVDECHIAIEHLTGDRNLFVDSQVATLAKIYTQKEMSPVRRSLMIAIAELHEKINDEQFEIFKCETMMQEINAITVAGVAESDMINRAKKLLLEGGMPAAFLRYCKGLASQKSDMYAEYRERILVLAEIVDRVVHPLVDAWKKAEKFIKPAIVLTKQAVSELTPGCPLYPIIQKELKKANVDYKDAPDALVHFARDENPFMVMAEMDNAFSFMEQMSNYLINESTMLTASLESSEIIRSWKGRCQKTLDDAC